MEYTYQSQENTELAKALLNVQRQLQPATKDSENPFTRSWYASLKSVMDTCRDALLNNGIWLCQYPVPVETPNCLGLMTKLTHVESGQWQSSLAVVPLPKADPQGMGSAITYARRYALTAMLGMVTEDDDGESAKSAQKTVTHARRPVNATQTQKAPSAQAGGNHLSGRPGTGREGLYHRHRQYPCQEGTAHRGRISLEPPAQDLVEIRRGRVAPCDPALCCVPQTQTDAFTAYHDAYDTQTERKREDCLRTALSCFVYTTGEI